MRNFNTQQDLVDQLTKTPFLSETELMKAAFGYDRNNSWRSNKKYADLLRRALESGKVDRVAASKKGSKARYFYFVRHNPKNTAS